MKRALLLLLLYGLAHGVSAEFRIWEDKAGNIWEGEFVTLSAGEVVMNDQAGKRIRIKPEKLCQADRLYLEKVVPPRLSIDVSKTTDNTGKGGSLGLVRCVVSIKQTDNRSYSGELTAVLLTMGADIRTGSARTVNKKEHTFKLPEKRGAPIQFQGDTARFQKSAAKSGTAYYGYVLVVWDRFGNVVAIKSNRDSLAEKGAKIARPSLKSRRMRK